MKIYCRTLEANYEFDFNVVKYTSSKFGSTFLNPLSGQISEWTRIFIELSGLKLVDYLKNYAATGEEYTKTLKKIINQNDLTDFDKAILMNSRQSSTLLL